MGVRKRLKLMGYILLIPVALLLLAVSLFFGLAFWSRSAAYYPYQGSIVFLYQAYNILLSGVFSGSGFKLLSIIRRRLL